MGKTIVILALWMSLGPSIGMVWVFRQLSMGRYISPDNLNVIEMWAAVGVLFLIVVALVLFVVSIVRKLD